MSELERETERTPRVTMTGQYGAAPEYREDMPNNWRVELRYRGRRLTTDFYGGSAVENITAADVLSSLILDANAGDQSFEDFCGDFGYDEDSRTAERTWRACAAMVPRLRRFLGDDYDRFASCEH